MISAVRERRPAIRRSLSRDARRARAGGDGARLRGRLPDRAVGRNSIGPSSVSLTHTRDQGGSMLLLVLLALLAIIAFGVGFTIHWLFIVAVVLAIVWLISLFAGGAGGRTRGAWWWP